MRRLLLILLLVASPALIAQTATTTTAPAEHPAATATHAAETEAQHAGAGEAETAHEGGEEHAEKKYFGIPAWILKLANMIRFFPVSSMVRISRALFVRSVKLVHVTPFS
jgi:hypothetical protein